MINYHKVTVVSRILFSIKESSSFGTIINMVDQPLLIMWLYVKHTINWLIVEVFLDYIQMGPER